MSRIAKSSPITAKMYRHFAVVTVVLTAALAMFADSDNREAAAEQVAAMTPKKPAEPKVTSETVNGLHVRQSSGGGSFGADEPVNGGDDFSFSQNRSALPLNDPRKRKRRPNTFFKDDLQGAPRFAPPPGPPGPWLQDASEARGGGAPQSTDSGWDQAKVDAIVQASRDRSGSEDASD